MVEKAVIPFVYSNPLTAIGFGGLIAATQLQQQDPRFTNFVNRYNPLNPPGQQVLVLPPVQPPVQPPEEEKQDYQERVQRQPPRHPRDMPPVIPTKLNPPIIPPVQIGSGNPGDPNDPGDDDDNDDNDNDENPPDDQQNNEGSGDEDSGDELLPPQEIAQDIVDQVGGNLRGLERDSFTKFIFNLVTKAGQIGLSVDLIYNLGDKLIDIWNHWRESKLPPIPEQPINSEEQTNIQKISSEPSDIKSISKSQQSNNAFRQQWFEDNGVPPQCRRRIYIDENGTLRSTVICDSDTGNSRIYHDK